MKTVTIVARNMSTIKTIDSARLNCLTRDVAPKLLEDKYKGQAGRIGVVGGSLEYTGAPYFAGISGLKVGADLIHVFCAKQAASVIKSYSPELIVHPILDDNSAVDKIKPWLDRLHVLVIGPGLGREPETLSTVTELINVCRSVEKPLVIDADGLFLVSEKPEVIKDYPGVILTPNAIEFYRIFGNDNEPNLKISELFGSKCVVFKKGRIDAFYSCDAVGYGPEGGSARRCGGQGDLLSGALAVFYYWARLKSVDAESVFTACYAASKLTKECNAGAYKRLKRSMTTSDMIMEIGKVFDQHFETSD